MLIQASFRLRLVSVVMALIACSASVMSRLAPLQIVFLLALIAFALGNSLRNIASHHLILDDGGVLQKVSPGGTAPVELVAESRVFGPMVMLAYADSGKTIHRVLLSDSVVNSSDWRRLRKWVRSRKELR